MYKKSTNVTIVKEKNTFWKIISNLPILLPINIAILGLSIVIMLLLESFSIVNIFILSTPMNLIVSYLVYRHMPVLSVGTLKERRVFDILMVVFLVGWIWFNLGHTSQNVYLYRDPGLYNSTARWLLDHEDVRIPSNNPFGEHKQLFTTSNAGVNMLKSEPDRLYTHGLHILPGINATVARITDHTGDIMKVNVVIGAVTLSVIYGFMRLIVKPRYSALGAVIMAVSLPFLYFTRDTFTEPISMMFIFSSLSFIFYANRYNSKVLWGLAGLMTGASALTRIDAYIGIAGILGYVILYLSFSKKKERKANLQNVLVFVTMLAIPVAIGWLDLNYLAKAYYGAHRSLMATQIKIIQALLIAGSAAVILSWKTDILKRLSKLLTKERLKLIFMIIAALSFLFVTLRPLANERLVNYEIQNIGGTESVVGQKAQTPDSTLYDTGEQVVNWPVWYLGIGVSILGLIGFIMMFRDIAKDRELKLVPFLMSFWIVALLFLFRPSITPDQIWASRRLLPVVLPGIVILSMYALSKVTIRITIKSILFKLVVASILIGGAYSTSSFYVNESTHANLLPHIEQFCDELPVDAAVLSIGNLGLVSTQTISSYCQVPSVRYFGDVIPTQEELAMFGEIAVGNGYTPIVATFGNDRGLLPEGSFINNLDVVNYKTIEKVFQKAPDELADGKREILYGVIDVDGVARGSRAE